VRVHEHPKNGDEHQHAPDTRMINSPT